MAIPDVEQDCTSILDSDDVKRALDRIAHEVIEANKGLDGVILLGIQDGGVALAERIAARLDAFASTTVPWAPLDVTPYRDDLSPLGVSSAPGNLWLGDLTAKKVVLVDDVMYTGRTIAAALRAIGDLGRPAKIQLAVLVDRGHREMPFQADFVGKNLPTNRNEHVKATLGGVVLFRGLL